MHSRVAAEPDLCVNMCCRKLEATAGPPKEVEKKQDLNVRLHALSMHI